MTDVELIEKAKEAARASYSPYSGFTVGAALITKDGKLYLGCNIESASYSPTCCAERTAFFKAVSDGERQFSKIAIVGGKGLDFKDFSPPCGVCRQVLSELLNQDTPIILSIGTEVEIYTIAELLPVQFNSEDLVK